MRLAVPLPQEVQNRQENGVNTLGPLLIPLPPLTWRPSSQMQGRPLYLSAAPKPEKSTHEAPSVAESKRLSVCHIRQLRHPTTNGRRQFESIRFRSRFDQSKAVSDVRPRQQADLFNIGQARASPDQLVFQFASVMLPSC
jgi:hypothetical protein